MAAAYLPIKEKIWNEFEEELELKETTCGDPQGYVESFLKRYADDESTMIYQSVIMEPARKPAKLSKGSSGKIKPLTSREKKRLGLKTLEHKYSLYQPLNELWTSYMLDLLKPHPKSNCKQLSLKVLKADYHGCYLKVVGSRCQGHIGIEGIVVQETQNTFKLINDKDKMLTIPKAHSVFQFKVKDHQFTLFGNQLRYRASDRSSKKYKDKFFHELF